MLASLHRGCSWTIGLPPLGPGSAAVVVGVRQFMGSGRSSDARSRFRWCGVFGAAIAACCSCLHSG